MGENRTGTPTVSAVIVAAGSGRRMGGAAKPFLPLAGRPVLAWVLTAFEQCAPVGDIVLVTRGSEKAQAQAIAAACAKPVRVVAGGATRQLSVCAGVKAAGGAFVAVHDGARPLVTPRVIEDVVRAAFACRAAAAAVHVKDTIKIAGADGLVQSTPARETLWAVQTPQVFEKALLLRAFDAAEADGKDYTDDCQLIEAAGGRVRLVEADYRNIKITTPEDMDVARAFLRAKEENPCG